MRFVIILALLSLRISSLAAPQLLDAQFELPRGFHIYRAAGPEISGGSYALTFDGEGRLLVGDGSAVRRLQDSEGDGLFDRFEVIATDLGWRGPQGLLVYGDRLYAVGGDGVQVFEGYSSGGSLQPKGRIGNKFLTGGDHDAHTLFRGHDGYIYLMAGNGAGISGRNHITESNSPALSEREASIFRISPDGRHWECLASGGRNPPNLGMNYLGDLFSFDSDMEWHVGLPWYRPVRLNHWVIGGDQGWQEVGAYPPYYIDCLPGILDVGRGSPTWGTFYEHNQLPNRFRNAFLVCDYRWKRESNDQYNTSGRLLAFFLKRKGASWSAEMETLVRPKSGARDASGKPISFALVDVTIAPDGSLIVSDHNQGLWRVYYGDKLPSLTTTTTQTGSRRRRIPVPTAMSQLLSLPQPGAEWSRAREEAIRAAGGPDLIAQLRILASNPAKTVEMRLAALRYLTPEFRELPAEFIQVLAYDKAAEIRAAAAGLLALRQEEEWLPLVRILLVDNDPFVRRRAAEALTRFGSADCANALIDRLADHSRTVRYAAMVALSHAPTSVFFSKAADRPEPAVRMRALVAALLRNELPSNSDLLSLIKGLLNRSLFPEERLDLLRILALFQKQITADHALHAAVVRKLEAEFPAPNRNVRWEQARLLGEYRVVHAFPKLLHALETEKDEVTQFHLAQAIARLPGGWIANEEERLLAWFSSTQRGWFADFAGKGVEFPQFWLTTLSDFASHHRSALLGNLNKVDLATLLGTVTLDVLAHEPDGSTRLIGLYRNPQSSLVRAKIASALASTNTAVIREFCRAELRNHQEPGLRGALLRTLARQTVEPKDASLFLDALSHSDLEVVRSSAATVARLKPELSRAQAEILLRRMNQGNSLCKLLDPLLVQLANPSAPSIPSRVTDEVRGARLKFWTEWYEKKYDTALPLTSSEKTDRQLMDFLMSDKVKSGDRLRGGLVYERLQCQSCHGGGVTPGREGRIFGPDLSGVTRRLSPAEFAESLVSPSKQVAERYKAYEITLNEGSVLAGFITEQDDANVTLADREQVHRIGRAQIRSITPQAASLMPEHLLNSLTWDEIKDLVAWLDDTPSAKSATR